MFEFHPPSGPAIGLLSIPHTGLEIPAEFEKFLEPAASATRNRDVDFSVHKLVNIPELQRSGVGVLRAQIHRICVDLNRAPNECLLFWRESSRGEKLIRSLPSSPEADKLRATHYQPYYDQIENFMSSVEPPLFVDLHSMPSKPTEYHLKRNPHQKLGRPDFCLSDLGGASATESQMNFLNSAFKESTSRVQINDPYLGGHLTSFGHRNGYFSVQIETNRALYMDEEKQELIEDHANKWRAVMTKILTSYFVDFHMKTSEP